MPESDAARDYFAQVFATTSRDQIQAVADLAYAQLQVEELRESDPDCAGVIDRPEGAADAAALRGILAAAKACRVEPRTDAETVREMGEYLADEGCLVWPPRAVEGVTQ